jgi:hypothetical protein
MAEELSSSLLQLILTSIPTFQAAEALLFLAAHRDRDFTVDEMVVGMRPRIITDASARQYGALFTDTKLVTETNGRFKYAPASVELDRSVCELSQAYNERPVTLIITIYHLAGGTLQPLTERSKPLLE